MPFGLKTSKEKKLLKKVIISKETIPSESAVFKILQLIEDEMSKRVLVHTIIKAMEKGLDEKKFNRMLCLLYRLMDVDTQGFLLDQFSIKEDMVMNTLPKGSSKNTKVFTKHTQLKVNLYSQYKIFLSAENDSQQFEEDETRDDIFGVIELLIEIAKNIEEFEFGTTNIHFHISDILLLELTVVFHKINYYTSTIANILLKLSIEEMQRFIEDIKNVDRIRHKYFTLLKQKEIKEKFENIPRLSFMPTGPLQTFLNKRIEAKKTNEFTGKIDREIESFNRTFQEDINQNDQTIKAFISRPLISIEDCEESRDSLSRSVSRSISRSASSKDPTLEGESSSYTGVGSYGRMNMSNRKEMARKFNPFTNLLIT